MIGQILPERLPEFVECYRDERRKAITSRTYNIGDFLTRVDVEIDLYEAPKAFSVNMLRQVAIVQAAATAASSVLRDIKSVVQSELFDSDIHTARELARSGHLRSAGVVCGVVIEAHLGSVCQGRGISVRKKNPGISDWNEALKKAGAYDVPTWRLLQRLGDIRNICAHAKDREPTPGEVDDLIAGADKITREVF